jgi:uncharacterized protein (TIGR04222 family)
MIAIASPFDLNAADFLTLYWSLAAVAIVGGGIMRRYFAGETVVPEQDEDPTPYEVACLAGGGARAVHAAIAQLCQDGFVSVDARSGDVSLVAPGDVAGRPPIEQAVLRAVAVQSPAKMSAVEAACAPAVADLEAALRGKGLLLRAERARLGWLVPSLAFAFVQLLGLIRFVVGLSRHKPVGFLVVSWLIVGFIGAKFFSRKLYRTRRGDAVLAGLRARYEALQRQAAATGEAGAPSPVFASLALPLAVGVFGYSILAGTPADSMYQRMRNTGSGDIISSSTDSSSSSDGGGDGGGGGGCGGCGGGGD